MVRWGKYWTKGHEAINWTNDIRNCYSFVELVFKGALVLSIGVGVYSISNFIFNYILVHNWSPAEYGIYSLIISITSILIGITEFNLNAVINIYLSKPTRDVKNEFILSNIIATYGGLVTCILIISCIIIYINYEYPLINVLKKYFLPIWLLVIISGLTSISYGLLRSYKRMEYEAISNIIKGATIVILTIITTFLFLNRGTESALLILIIAQILSLCIAIIFIFKIIEINLSVNAFIKVILGNINLSYIKSLILFSSLISFISIFILIISSADRIIIPIFSSASMLGFYSGAKLIASIPKIITVTAATSLISFATENSDKEDLKKKYLSFEVVYILLILIWYGLFIVFTPILISITLPESYNLALTSARILLVGMFFSDIFSVNSTFVASIGRTSILRQLIIILIIGIILNICLNWILIPKIGIEGAAIANAISFALIGTISLALIVIKEI